LGELPADFGLVEQIVADAHRRLAADGMAKAELTLLDRSGLPGAGRRRSRGFRGRNLQAQRRRDRRTRLPPKPMSRARSARSRAETGGNVSIHARKKIAQATGCAPSAGRAGFPRHGIGDAGAHSGRTGVRRRSSKIEAGIQIFIAAALAAMAAMGLLIGALSVPPDQRADRRHAGSLAGGDTSLDVPVRTRADELGEMGRAVQIFKENALEAERLRIEAGAAEAAAEAAESRRAAPDGRNGGIRNRQCGRGSRGQRRGVQSTTDGMAGLGRHNGGKFASVAAAAEEALANVQTVSSAAEEACRRRSRRSPRRSAAPRT